MADDKKKKGGGDEGGQQAPKAKPQLDEAEIAKKRAERAAKKAGKGGGAGAATEEAQVQGEKPGPARLRLLIEKGRAAEVREIAAELDVLVDAEEHILDVELTTAHELSEDEFGRILGQIEEASGRKVQATRSVDPDLIGGIVLQAGSMRLDASVRGRLDRLSHDFAQARS